MNFRPLGQTGLKVSIVALGASPLGGVFGAVEEKGCRDCVHAALDAGVNFIDVSPYYGLTKAETMLGKCLKGVPRESYYLATKVGRYGPEIKDFDFSADRVARSVEESLTRLGVEYVDLIQCHDIEFGSYDQVVQETIPALFRLRDQGKVRFVGVTGLPLKAFKTVVESTTIDTILSYCHYSLNDTALQSIIPLLKSKAVGIISASPMSMGLLTRQGPPSWHPASSALKQACAAAVATCTARGEDISRLAMQFSSSNPDIATTIVGTSKAENIRKNITWAHETPDPVLLADVQKILAPVKDLTWLQGHPHNN